MIWVQTRYTPVNPLRKNILTLSLPSSHRRPHTLQSLLSQLSLPKTKAQASSPIAPPVFRPFAPKYRAREPVFWPARGRFPALPGGDGLPVVGSGFPVYGGEISAGIPGSREKLQPAVFQSLGAVYRFGSAVFRPLKPVFAGAA